MSMPDGSSKLAKKARVRISYRESLQSEPTWCDATRIWPETDDVPGLDIAVLDVDPADLATYAGEMFNKANWTLNFDHLEEEHETVARGYPQFLTRARDVDSRAIEMRKYYGDLIDVDGRSDPKLILDGARTDPPKAPEGWRGLSGAAVIEDDVIHAVVTKAEVETRENRTLIVQPLNDLRNNRDFRTLFERRLAPRRPAASQPIKLKPEHVNRMHDKSRFVRSLKPKWAEISKRHILVLHTGHERDGLSLCARRLVHEAMIEESKTICPTKQPRYNRLVSMDLRNADWDIDSRVAEVLGDLAKTVDPTLGLYENAETYEKALLDNAESTDFPRMLAIEHAGMQIENGCMETIKRVLKILGKLPAMDPPLFVFLQFVTGMHSSPTELPVNRSYYDGKKELLDSVAETELAKFALNELKDSFSPLVCFGTPGDTKPSDLNDWLVEYTQASKQRQIRNTDAAELYSKLTEMDEFPHSTAVEILERQSWEPIA